MNKLVQQMETDQTEVLKETKEESIRKCFIVDGVYRPKLECSALNFNQSKLKNEHRTLNLISQRAYKVKRKMGAEAALKDMLSYLEKWKKENLGWQEKSSKKLRELEINLNEKGKIDE